MDSRRWVSLEIDSRLATKAFCLEAGGYGMHKLESVCWFKLLMFTPVPPSVSRFLEVLHFIKWQTYVGNNSPFKSLIRIVKPECEIFPETFPAKMHLPISSGFPFDRTVRMSSFFRMSSSLSFPSIVTLSRFSDGTQKLF